MIRGEARSWSERSIGVKKFVFAVMMMGVLCSGPQAFAGPVMGQTETEEAALTERPDRKPAKCIGLVNVPGGVVLPKGKVAAALKYVHVHKNDLYEGDDRKTGEYGGKYDRVNDMVQLSAKVGLGSNMDVRVMVPFARKEVKRKSGNPPRHWDSTRNEGLGDVVVMGRYGILSQRTGDWLSLAFGAGVKTPTGDYDQTNDKPFSNSHMFMGPGFQLGTGSWDPKIELGATRMFGQSRIDAHVMYTVPGSGAHGSRKGKQFKYGLGYGYALNRHFDLEMEINGVDQQSHRYDSEPTCNTGGHTVYVTPGVHWKITDSMHFSVATPLVVYRRINGETELVERFSKYGISEDYQVVTRLGFTF